MISKDLTPMEQDTVESCFARIMADVILTSNDPQECRKYVGEQIAEHIPDGKVKMGKVIQQYLSVYYKAGIKFGIERDIISKMVDKRFVEYKMYDDSFPGESSK